MIDKREALLARLVEVAATVVGADKTFRNTLDIPEHARPAVLILDADEELWSGGDGRGHSADGPRPMNMTPEIFILMGDSPEVVGTALNLKRWELFTAIVKDASLVALCHKGQISYLGFQTGFADGRTMEAVGQLRFEFQYVLRPIP